MSISQVMQNTRCYMRGSISFKNNAFKILLRRYSAADTEEIVIPKRIPRGPTDILKALASTIKRDPRAPHYKFHDDPYLTPVSNYTKRTFALSQEAGRKAAMWIKEEHPELFQHRTADPPIEAFFPKPRYDEFDDLDDTVLLKTIKTASVNDSIALYKLMTKNNIPVSDESKLRLLELICFFNENEGLAEELVEERWFFQVSSDEKYGLKKTWKDNGFAQELFSSLPPSATVYSAMIMGMVKYFQIEQADKLYKEALAKGFALSPGAYNSMLKGTCFLREGWTQRWQFMLAILADMNEHGCKPNLSTLNTILDILVRNPNVLETKKLALQVIAEVGKFGVEPSLGSYHFLLNLFCKSGDRPSFILEDILDLLEGKELTARDITDTSFFTTAMEKCRYYYNNPELAFRLNNLLWNGNNYNLIGTSYKESSYYRHFFILLCRGELLENIMDQYNFYVPHIYSPEMSVMEELINVITMNGAVELYPRIWTDMVMFDMGSQSKVVVLLLQGMVLNRIPLSSPPAEMAVKLADTAYSVFAKSETDSLAERPNALEWTNELLGDILLICLCGDDFEKSLTIFKKMLKDERTLMGMPCVESMEMLVDASIQRNDMKLAMRIMQYCHDNTIGDAEKLARKLVREAHLSPAYTSHLIAMFGQNIMKEDSPKKTRAVRG